MSDPSKKISNFNRRKFIQAGISVAGLSALSALPSQAEPLHDEPLKVQEPDNSRMFPKGFLWGTATASYQVEGAVNEDGRGKTIWDTFSHQPGKVKNNETGDVACDMYHRYKDDVKLMKEMNAQTFRFSIAWSRIFPDGVGKPNPKGLDYYDRLTDELLANGITPFATLYHWDLPQHLQDKYKGWLSRETAYAFGEYAGYIARKLGDRVKHFFTMNEIRTFVELGYGNGQFAPGLKLEAKGLHNVRHHAALAHGLGVQAIRSHGKFQVGLAENLDIPVPIIDTREHILASQIAMREENAGYLSVIMDGKYTDHYLQKAGANAPDIVAGDLNIISSPLDLLGLNIYMPSSYVEAASNTLGYQLIPFASSHPRSTSEWHRMGPESLYWGPKNVYEIWKTKSIYITENGYSSADEITANGKIYDTDRISFMRSYLTQLQRATAEQVPVKGYFYWSMMDNFEWASGYGTRFGLYYIDYKTLKRHPKESVEYFKTLAVKNQVV
ncbi:beta-glucosidase [Mucilaginibacter daejeonensis]|uniref:GH1 family beta-glucosidase n=1 Tax=Mucilaginibacter daejeonensis TaxID=398049 RepID=UPI001D177094|nr:GH1 family beta-glucosidase [Mucilaginibacter daejeonensis]UEG51903.1 beta-glucosidase [Mucilaginibacter daejeonensis]